MTRKLLNYIKIVFVISVVIFLARFLIKNIEELRALDFRFNYYQLSIAFIFFIIYKFTQGLLWHYITKKNRANIALDKAIISYFYSQLGKFIPGKVFLLGGRLYFYHKEGISNKKTTFCFFIENICTLLGAAFLFLGSLFFIDVPLFREYRSQAIFLVFLLVIIIHPRLLQAIINVPLKMLKRETVTLDIKYRDILGFVFLFTINWFIVGMGFYILVNSIYPVGAENIFYISGSFGLAVIIGLLSLFAPSGIGVREGIMIFALKNIMPQTAAVVVSVVARLWMTAGELLLVGVVYLYARQMKIVFNDSKVNELD